jgi:hypothetical protein
MIKFKIDGVEHRVPEFISIEDYSKIYKIKDLFSDDYFAAKLISMVTDAKVEDLLESDYQEVSYLASYIMSLIPIEKPEFVDRFELDGVKYGFFPSWKELTFAEFIDMDTLSTKKPEEILDVLHILAAIMYRPITEEKSEHDFKIEKYDVKTMTERAELFKKKLNVKYILGAQFFFIKFANRFSSYTQISSIQTLSIWTKIKITWAMRKLIWNIVFRKRSVGSLSSTELLEMILQSTNTSIKKTSRKS